MLNYNLKKHQRTISNSSTHPSIPIIHIRVGRGLLPSCLAKFPNRMQRFVPNQKYYIERKKEREIHRPYISRTLLCAKERGIKIPRLNDIKHHHIGKGVQCTFRVVLQKAFYQASLHFESMVLKRAFFSSFLILKLSFSSFSSFSLIGSVIVFNGQCFMRFMHLWQFTMIYIMVVICIVHE